jgi:hypothetical protein
MSAREELFESLTPAYRAQYAPGEEESVNALLDAYRDEVLREAADRIRNSKHLRDYTDDHMRDCNEAADEIDPEVKP